MRRRSAATGRGASGHGGPSERPLRRRVGGKRGGRRETLAAMLNARRAPGGAAVRVDRRRRPLPAGPRRAGGRRRGRGRPGRPPAVRRRGARDRGHRAGAASAQGRPGAVQRLVGHGRASRRSSWSRGRRLLEALQTAAALSMEGFRANLSPIDRRVVAARPAPGQEWAAAGLRELAAPAARWPSPGAARRLQDPLSFRCVSHDARFAARRLRSAGGSRRARAERRLATTRSCSPRDDAIISTGNFHTPAIALAADAVAIATRPGRRPRPPSASAGCAAERSAACPPTSPRAAELGRDGAAPEAGPGAGRARSATWPRRSRSTPASAPRASRTTRPTPPGGAAADRSARSADRLIALELVCAAQAVDLAAPARLGAGTAAMQRAVRALVRAAGRRPLARRRHRAGRRADRVSGLELTYLSGDAIAQLDFPDQRLLAAVERVLARRAAARP